MVDFGLVKDLEHGGGAGLTQADVVAGTPLYLSPEAITPRRRWSAASDLYSLGAVGYFALTGTHVFDGRTLVEVCSHHLHTAPEPPSARLARPVDPELESLILDCLAKDPAARRPGPTRCAAASRRCDALRRLDDRGRPRLVERSNGEGARPPCPSPSTTPT